MIIAITTFMRERTQKALAQIPEALHPKVRMFTRLDRVEELRKHVPETIKIIPHPMEVDGIADTRQRVLDGCDSEKVWMIDDLCQFGYRDPSNPKKLITPITDERFIELYDRIEKLLESYAQVGISPRMGNNRVEGNLVEIGRAYTTYGLNKKILGDHRIRFDEMWQKDHEAKFYEDYYLTLSLLTKGMKNVIIYDFVFLYAHNKSGGNSTTRTLELQEKSAVALRKEFPEFVELTRKEGDWNGNGMSGRIEPLIQWQKAFKSYDPNKVTLETFFS